MIHNVNISDLKLIHTSIGNTSPTVKLENQFTIVETETAADRGPWEKISATINQGIDPEVKHEKTHILTYQLRSTIYNQAT